MLALIVYLAFGLDLARRVLPAHRGAVKLWLGLVFGCIALMWLPCVAAVFVGFTMTAQWIGLAVPLAAEVLFAVWCGVKRSRAPAAEPEDVPARPRLSPPSYDELTGLLLAAAVTAFCTYLLHTHVLLPHDDGSLWVGQSTYGDLAMHLGFVESLYRQGFFPPEYSIFPGAPLDYPFLVDAASASLRFFGMSLRMAVIVPSVVMLFCVFYGFWLLAQTLAERLAPTLAAWLLFVFNGGFGFMLFLTGKYSFTDLMEGFYITPTNLVDEDLRWVNVICDMLIPQRTTMAGWCVVLAAIYLLITALKKTVAEGSGQREFAVLAVVAGSMPMIHTHSFLALGVLSAGWFFAFLDKAKKNGRLRGLVKNYVLYGGVCLALALPQLIVWTFDAASSGNLLRLGPGWVHGNMNWFWFWLVNGGVVFCVIPVMMLFLRGDDGRLFWGAAALFALANLVLFQPNPYDNNKLLYIWYMVVDILACKWLFGLLSQIRLRPLAWSVAAAAVILGTASGGMTMLREAVSEYQLFSAPQVEAARFITENTPPDSLFLTSTAHTNPVAVLTGRNILCGPGLYLYYHGIDYQQRESQIAQMYWSGAAFEHFAEQYGVDYVFISGTEYADYQVNYDYFARNHSLIYEKDGISIFQIS